MSQTGWTHVDKFVSSATFLQGDTVIKNSLMLRTGVSWKKHRDHKLPLLRFAGSSKFRLLLWPALVPCLADPLRREIGHCAFLAPARLACTSTPAVFNFGDFWLELATRMVSTGLNQAGWGRSIRPRAKFDPAWTELGGWDNSRYVWILHTDSGSAAFAVDPSQLSPRYTMLLGGGRLGWRERPSVPTFDSLMQHCWGGLWPINCFVIPHRLDLFKRDFCVFSA